VSRYILGLIDDICDGEACEASRAWAAELPEWTTAREAWEQAPSEWHEEVRSRIGVRSFVFEHVRDRLTDLGVYAPPSPARETAAFFALLVDDPPPVPPHPADLWTLAALTRAA